MEIVNLFNWEKYLSDKLTHFGMGHRCNNIIKTIEVWLEDLENIKDGNGSLKVMSGETLWPCMDVIEYLLENRYPKITNITWIAGPIISVNEKGENAILRLADKGRITLYVDRVIALRRFRIIQNGSNPYVFREGYHEPFEDRTGERFELLYQVESFVNEYDVAINKLGLEKYEKCDKNGFIKMTINEIEMLNNILIEHYISINTLGRETIERIIKEFKIKSSKVSLCN